MKDVTADNVLRKTFELLEAVMDEKSRQIKKVSEESQTLAFSSKKINPGTEKTKK